MRRRLFLVLGMALVFVGTVFTVLSILRAVQARSWRHQTESFLQDFPRASQPPRPTVQVEPDGSISVEFHSAIPPCHRTDLAGHMEWAGAPCTWLSLPAVDQDRGACRTCHTQAQQL